MKTCKSCGKTKPLEEFRKDNRNIDGRTNTCYKCYNSIRKLLYSEYDKVYAKQWRKNHPDNVRNSKHESYEKHKAKACATSKKWRIANPDKTKQYHRNYSANRPDNVKAAIKKFKDANQERINAENKIWRLNNKDKCRDYCENRRARLKERLVGVVNRSEIFTRDKGICHICGQPVDVTNWHLDHILPLIAGGSHSYYNVAVSHPKCNMAKGSSIIVYWEGWT